MLADTGCDFVMIARGALGNPWIFREAAILWGGGVKPDPPTPTEKKEMLLRHLKDLIEEKGEYTAVLEMRKFVGWYLKGLAGAAEIRRRANSIKEAGELMTLISEFKTK